MSLRENVKQAFHGHNSMAVALSKIARGREDCGRPLSSETSRQLARGVLTDLGLDWTHILKTEESLQRKP